MCLMRYVVTGGTGFIGRRVVSRSAGRPTGRRGVGPGSPRIAGPLRTAGRRLGRPGKTAGRRPDRSRVSASATRPSPSSATSITWCTARRSTTSPPPKPSSAPPTSRAPGPSSSWPDGSTRRCTTSRRSRSPATFHGEFTEDDFDVGAGAADAVSPDEVRGRAAGALDSRDCATGCTGPRWWSAIRAPARWTRSTGRTTSSACWRSWPCCRGSPRSCCPTPAAPTSCRSTMSPTPSSHCMHADGRDGQTFHLTAPKTIGLRGIYRGIADAAGLPPLRGSLPRCGGGTVPRSAAAAPRCGATWSPPNSASPARSSTSSTSPRPSSSEQHRRKRCAAPG